MNRLLRPFIAGSLIAAATVVSASGCADNNSTLFIVGVLYSKAPTCQATADPSVEELGYGVLDVAFRTDYQAWLLVGNQFTPRGSKQTLRTETTRTNLRGAEVTLTDSEGKALLDTKKKEIPKFSVYGSGFADSSTSSDPGWGLFAADLIPASVGEELRAEVNGSRTLVKPVIATVRVFGTTLGNTDVTSGELSFPIQVCYGCLIQYPLVAIEPPATTGAPSTCTAPSTDVPTPGCRIGQDDYIDCRSCSDLTVCTNVP